MEEWFLQMRFSYTSGVLYLPYGRLTYQITIHKPSLRTIGIKDYKDKLMIFKFFLPFIY
jgi:hypothetical protein